MSDSKKTSSMKLFAIYDERAKKFGSFMFSDTKENAVRQYLQMIASTPFYSDFWLYEILTVSPFTEVDFVDANTASVFGLVEYDGILKNVTPSLDEVNAYREHVIKFEQLLNKR